MTISATALNASLNPSREPALVVVAGAQVPRQVVRLREAEDPETEKKAVNITPMQANAALAEVNQSLQLASIGVRFEFDKEARTMVTKVVDVETGERIRQIPTEEVVRISKMLSHLQGLLVSEKV